MQVQVQREGGAHLRRPRCARSCARTPTSSSSARSATRRRRTSPSRPSLTGHLVLSTLHTNDAASSVDAPRRHRRSRATRSPRRSRASSRSGSCGGSAPLPRAGGRARCRIACSAGSPNRATLYRGVGCAECSMTGYRGRLAIDGGPDRDRRGRAPHRRRRDVGPHRTTRRARAGCARSGSRGVQHVRQGETTHRRAPPRARGAARNIRRASPARRPRGSSSVECRAPAPRDTPGSRSPRPSDEEGPAATDSAGGAASRSSAPSAFTGDSFELVDDGQAKRAGGASVCCSSRTRSRCGA